MMRPNAVLAAIGLCYICSVTSAVCDALMGILALLPAS